MAERGGGRALTEYNEFLGKEMRRVGKAHPELCMQERLRRSAAAWTKKKTKQKTKKKTKKKRPAVGNTRARVDPSLEDLKRIAAALRIEPKGHRSAKWAWHDAIKAYWCRGRGGRGVDPALKTEDLKMIAATLRVDPRVNKPCKSEWHKAIKAYWCRRVGFEEGS